MLCQTFFEQMECARDTVLSGAYRLLGDGGEVEDTPTDRLLTCEYNDWRMNNPPHFLNPTQHSPFPHPQQEI